MEEQMIDLRLARRFTVAAFFAADKPKERETLRKDLPKVPPRRERVTESDLDDELQSGVRVLKAGQKGVTPFHWELEFLRSSDSAGFDGIVGNPPLLARILSPKNADGYRLAQTAARGVAWEFRPGRAFLSPRIYTIARR